MYKITSTGGGVEQREQKMEDPLTAQPEKENKLSQTSRSVRRVCVRVVPPAQSKLSCALHVHRGKKLLQDLQNLDKSTIKRAMVQESARKECHDICRISGDLIRKHDGGPPVEGDHRQDPGIAWRGGTYLLEGGCVMAMAIGKKPPVATLYSPQRSDGALSPTIE